MRSISTKIFASDGVICRNCGGLMIRTGSCHTCTTCGDTTGCGRTNNEE